MFTSSQTSLPCQQDVLKVQLKPLMCSSAAATPSSKFQGRRLIGLEVKVRKGELHKQNGREQVLQVWREEEDSE